jgi:pimeloyl-ACP methyl ester carboxylesterase
MDLIADDAAAVLDAAGVERAIVCGLSMGGYAAFSFWRRHRQRVRALILADTRAGADSEEGKTGRETFARSALERGIDWVASEMLPKLQRAEPEASVQAQLRALILANRTDGVAAAQRGMALRPDSTPVLAQIDCPCLVIVGAEDSLTGPEQAKAMAESIPDCGLSVLDEAGHVANLEAAAQFNAAVAALIGRLE